MPIKAKIVDSYRPKARVVDALRVTAKVTEYISSGYNPNVWENTHIFWENDFNNWETKIWPD